MSQSPAGRASHRGMPAGGYRVLLGPTFFSALLIVIAHVVFWIWVQPANTTMKAWSLDAISPDWTRWRNQWEYAHAVRAALIVASFAALLISLLRGRSGRTGAQDAPAQNAQVIQAFAA